MDIDNIRWIQRYDNFCRALSRLGAAVDAFKNLHPDIQILEEAITEMMVQRFEYTQELAWKVMKDYIEYIGHSNNVMGSRGAFKEALQLGLISDPRWMETIEIRNLSVHTYDENKILKAATLIAEIYYPLFVEFKIKMEEYI